MAKKEYKKPEINKVVIDNEISLVLMSYDDVDNPPPPPPGGPGSAAQANPFEQNSFDQPLK